MWWGENFAATHGDLPCVRKSAEASDIICGSNNTTSRPWTRETAARPAGNRRGHHVQLEQHHQPLLVDPRGCGEPTPSIDQLLTGEATSPSQNDGLFI